MKITEDLLISINNKIPNNLLDGFWINDFENGVLDISASFNRIYYRNISIEFTGVTFFNLPESWQDSDVATASFLKLGHQKSFESTFSEIDISNKLLIDVYLNMPVANNEKELYGFSIVCDDVAITNFTADNGFYDKRYKDPLVGKMKYPIIQNRVPYF